MSRLRSAGILPVLGLVGLAALGARTARAGESLTGKWELQSLGGDRTVNLLHRGNKLVAHRVIMSEFEGKPYRLEHLFRGNIRRGVISGKLLVKSGEVPDFEPLRSFEGKIRSIKEIVLDGMPIKRTGRLAAPGSEATRRLFKVSSELEGHARRAEATIALGDARFKKGRFSAALAVYMTIKDEKGRIHAAVFHRIGRCHLRLGGASSTRAIGFLRRAARLDPYNAALRRELRLAAGK